MSPSSPGAFPDLVFLIASCSSESVIGSSNRSCVSVGSVGIPDTVIYSDIWSGVGDVSCKLYSVS